MLSSSHHAMPVGTSFPEDEVHSGVWAAQEPGEASVLYQVLYITEEMLRRYSDPVPCAKMALLKIDGSRRDDKIRFASSPVGMQGRCDAHVLSQRLTPNHAHAGLWTTWT